MDDPVADRVHDQDGESCAEPTLGRRWLNVGAMFALVSMLVLLAGFLVPAVSEAMASRRDDRRMEALWSINSAIQAYFHHHGRFPAGEEGGWDTSHDGVFLPDLMKEGFLEDLHLDPRNGNQYHFVYRRFSGNAETGEPDSYLLGIRGFEGENAPVPHRPTGTDLTGTLAFALVGSAP